MVGRNAVGEGEQCSMMGPNHGEQCSMTGPNRSLSFLVHGIGQQNLLSSKHALFMVSVAYR